MSMLILVNCSSLYNTRVVLRKLTSVQAQRRGKRAIEVSYIDVIINEILAVVEIKIG